MEELMYFVWQQRLFHTVVTLDGLPLDVVHPGLRNPDAGPDFFNAKIRMGDIMWAGNVEMHVKSSDWHRHHHDNDHAYDSVILHVVLEADSQILKPDGSPLQTVIMKIPESILTQYKQLCGGTSVTPLLPGQTPTYSCISCGNRLGQIPKIIKSDWFTALCTQRMMQKMERVRDLVVGGMQSWQEAFYVILTRSLGTGVNSDAMERLARSLPYNHLLHHRDSLVQLKALLLGQAGYLQMIDAVNRPAEEQEEWKLMQREYAFLRQKFSLTPLPGTVWQMGRIRPPAQPDSRLMALAQLIYNQPDLFGRICEAQSINQLEQLLRTPRIGMQTRQSLIINAVIPTLLSYHQWQGDDEGCETALRLLEELPPESNRYIRQWQEVGIEAHNAFETQALLQLFRSYCQPHQCLRCRLGCWLLKNKG